MIEREGEANDIWKAAVYGNARNSQIPGSQKQKVNVVLSSHLK